MVPNRRSDENQVEGSTGAGMDQSKNSMRSVHFFQLLSFSPLLSLPLRRQHSLLSTQALLEEDCCCGEQGRAKDSQEIFRPQSTPSKLEPDNSSLESGSWGGYSGSWSLGTTKAQETYWKKTVLLKTQPYCIHGPPSLGGLQDV